METEVKIGQCLCCHKPREDKGERDFLCGDCSDGIHQWPIFVCECGQSGPLGEEELKMIGEALGGASLSGKDVVVLTNKCAACREEKSAVLLKIDVLPVQ